MSIFENAFFIVESNKIYATESLFMFIWFVFFIICLSRLFAAFLPKIMLLTSRFACWCKTKIQNKKRKEK